MMTHLKTCILLHLFLLILQNPLHAQADKWKDFKKDSIQSSIDGEMQYFYYYKTTSQTKQPLVVSLHQWGADYKEYNNSLAPQTKARDWNYIHPDIRGANKHIKACGSKYVIGDIDDAIDWAIENLPVDKTQIYIVGASGGGYSALCSLMKSRHKIKEYSVWVPITDLKAWYYESKERKNHYAKNIINCTCGSDCKELDENKAMERSPLYWETPVCKLETTQLNIYVGVHDGHTGAVPITHSILFYNKIVSDLGGSEDHRVSGEDIDWMLMKRTAPKNTNRKIGSREIIYENSYGNVSVTIFEGGHEILVNEVIKE